MRLILQVLSQNTPSDAPHRPTLSYLLVNIAGATSLNTHVVLFHSILSHTQSYLPPFSHTLTTLTQTFSLSSPTLGVNGARDCVEKNDMIFFLDPSLSAKSIVANPKYFNLYTVSRVFKYARSMYPPSTANPKLLYGTEIVLNMPITSAWNPSKGDRARAYVFHPPLPQDTHPYAVECSNRGICSTNSGLCM